MKKSLFDLLGLCAFFVLLVSCQGFKGSNGNLSQTFGGPGPIVSPTPNPTPSVPPVCKTEFTAHWTIPTLNVDGTPCTDLAGYRLYYGTTSGSYTTMVDISNPTATTQTVTGLSAATYYVVATAYKNIGGTILESAYTNQISVQLLPCLKAVLNANTGKVQYEEPSIEAEVDETL